MMSMTQHKLETSEIKIKSEEITIEDGPVPVEDSEVEDYLKCSPPELCTPSPADFDVETLKLDVKDEYLEELRHENRRMSVEENLFEFVAQPFEPLIHEKSAATEDRDPLEVDVKPPILSSAVIDDKFVTHGDDSLDLKPPVLLTVTGKSQNINSTRSIENPKKSSPAQNPVDVDDPQGRRVLPKRSSRENAIPRIRDFIAKLNLGEAISKPLSSAKAASNKIIPDGLLKQATNPTATQGALTTVKEAKTFTCDRCNSTLKRRDNFIKHMKQHLDEDVGRTYPCEKCKKRFPRPTEVVKHMRNAHSSNPKPQTCKECGKSAKNFKCLRAHIKSKHPSLYQQSGASRWQRYRCLDTKFTCHKCNSTMIGRSTFIHHMNHHIDQEVGVLYSCRNCGRSYQRKKDLLKHHRNIHGEDSTPKKCTMCDSVLKNSRSLQTHYKSAHQMTVSMKTIADDP